MPTIAPCGLDCSACAIYIAAHDPEAAERLAKQWRQGISEKAKAEWFRCQGCRGDKSVRWCDDCKIAECAEERGLEFCSQCDDFPCVLLLVWAEEPEPHRIAFERLKQMRDAGE